MGLVVLSVMMVVCLKFSKLIPPLSHLPVHNVYSAPDSVRTAVIYGLNFSRYGRN